ncbi:uncharacterized protein BKA78DRAFT_321796 [Phyllosticta capitalensis]|uniref:uncharacterized protein n=1 Tax=Phyllosticta capitalensis TaxID=121624 RepID=UPI0031326B7D
MSSFKPQVKARRATSTHLNARIAGNHATPIHSYGHSVHLPSPSHPATINEDTRDLKEWINPHQPPVAQSHRHRLIDVRAAFPPPRAQHSLIYCAMPCDATKECGQGRHAGMHVWPVPG